MGCVYLCEWYVYMYVHMYDMMCVHTPLKIHVCAVYLCVHMVGVYL